MIHKEKGSLNTENSHELTEIQSVTLSEKGFLNILQTHRKQNGQSSKKSWPGRISCPLRCFKAVKARRNRTLYLPNLDVLEAAQSVCEREAHRRKTITPCFPVTPRLAVRIGALL